jgi:hypothetical protein
MRKLTVAEIHKLSEEYQAYSRWECAIDYARKYYAGTPTRIVVDTTSEYNDEGGYYNVIESVTVYGEDGILDFDYPKAAAALKEQYSYLQKSTSSDEDLVNDHEYEIREELYAEAAEYDVNDPPKITFPEVFVPEGEAAITGV